MAPKDIDLAEECAADCARKKPRLTYEVVVAAWKWLEKRRLDPEVSASEQKRASDLSLRMTRALIAHKMTPEERAIFGYNGIVK
jgi:hypothetical protein